MSKPTDYDRDVLDPVVIRLWRASVPDAQIAQEIGYSLRTVRRVRHRLRLLDRCTPAPHVEDSTLLAYAAEGLTWAEIAERTGFTHRTVQERMSRLRCPAPNQTAAVLPVPPADDDTTTIPRRRRLPLPVTLRAEPARVEDADQEGLRPLRVLTRGVLADLPAEPEATVPQP